MDKFAKGFVEELEKLSAKFKLKPPKIKAPKGEISSPLTKVKSPSRGVGIKKFYVGE